MRALKSAILVKSGFTHFTRNLHHGEACILMFHGLRVNQDEGLLDPDLHTPVATFRAVCAHLARHFKVRPLSEIVAALQQGRTPPSGTVALTFDDGYASNYELAFPVLREFDVPATIFPATCFLDKTETPWFIRAEFAMAHSQRETVLFEIGGQRLTLPLQTHADRVASLTALQKLFKAMPQEELGASVGHLENALDVRVENSSGVPAIFQPLTWDQAREMQRSGLVEFGGHTHRHLILGRCQPETARQEIAHSRERLTRELGVEPTLFAYPNGQDGDHTSDTAQMLLDAGYAAAATTSAGFVRGDSNLLTLPRCGTPLTHFHAEATVSGAFDTLKQWRKKARCCFSRHTTPDKKSGAGTVLHFTPRLDRGGAEMMLCNLIEAMHGGPWRTVLVTMQDPDDAAHATHLRGLVDAYYNLNSDAYMRPAMWARLNAIIRRERPDVVQTWMHRADFIGGMIARSAGVKHVVWGIHSRSIYRSPEESDFKIALYTAALRAVSGAVPERIVSCSEAAINDHKARGYPLEKMTWIPNGICTTRFVPDAAQGEATRRELGIPAGVPLIGFVGRFHEVKNLSVFFQAAALFQKRIPNAHFVLCGGTEDDLDYATRLLLEELPGRTQIHFMPFRFDPEKLYPAFSLLALCSKSEALPMVILEAMACGVPCVSTDVGDCASIIGDTGLTVPVGEVQALADAWTNILVRTSVERTTAAIQMRARIKEQFSITRVAHKYEETYDRLRLTA